MSKVTKDFLFELGTEELPPKALRSLAESLLNSVETQLKDAKVGFGGTKWFASPRRLSFIIKDLAESQEDIVVEKQGPLVSIAYKDGEPTKVALGFASSCGVKLDQLDRVETPKGDKLFYKTIQSGQLTVSLLQEIITKALKQLSIPKMMRWGDSVVEFVRPVHWVLALYGNEIVDIEILGHKASNITYGHRFHHPDVISINEIAEYERVLAEAKVLVDWEQRKQMLIEQAKKIAKENNYKVILDDDLVEEVCAIVEYPNAMLCSFNKDFLRVPQEALISSMEEHQKCFALLDSDNNLVANFITISNIESKKPELVTSGNQKVMNARLADAAFFYDTDLKKSLEQLLPRLENVTFQNKLGNMYQKAQRIANTAQKLADLNNVDSQQAYRAGLLAKADLISDMVFEFTDLQGIIGKYYAKAHGETDIVADAIEQQYWPKYSGAELPRTDVAACVALAEKLDTLVGIFGIGQKPTGNKDPFALRRSAIGILRILRDTNIDIALEKVIEIALDSYKEVNSLEFSSDIKAEVVSFCLDRLKNLYKDEGVAVNIFESVINTKYDSIKDFAARIMAVTSFISTDKAQSLIASNKRVANILSKNASEDKKYSYNIEIAKTAGNEYELALAYSIEEISADLDKYLGNREYNYALELLTCLDKVIAEFFENVMVMDDDASVRDNRIALLATIHKMFVGVADISKL
ncbi:glycine--tRNA ligase subunit beta [Francisella philomiragia]|uniref:Glycine--tRNA ligase beta subunit n=1 Tax=Francisella philomiragia TaxID=28110 RepID=A0AAW3D9N4_9GAMM|nr:glycine--tRNA ligase subunit beta [Francisella philomiragia]KFJ42290.1 glycine--tRNA ligase, beta subunit [Francisella philomiragia]MBK2254285.1 glycine--tRNA ligase subunit beta [Francisella philomiragia]MBK2272598.1 glycine--tRNA ligase subunit beta [Francisella philomiragia]MBK2276439.1 glycine--tRNA ligase subunit beta [Francisella philomiragia]MBK2280386.1 glycine--tRNA ligase subunit beta [Francisella philomiragia]